MKPYHNSTMKKDSSSQSLPRRPIMGAPSYHSSLKGLQEQALLHRICAEVMSSPSNGKVLVVPDNVRSSWVRPEHVLEILDGALCIVEDAPLLRPAPLTYKEVTKH